MMFNNKEKIIKRAYNDLKTIHQVKENKFDFENYPQRNKVRICVIDDEGFPKKNQLSKLGYSDVTELYNFESIESLKDYDVILCDMDGVGKVLDSKKQGLAVVEQLKINYPLKKIFIYSGKEPAGYGEIPDGVEYISKQYSASELSKFLDNKCSYYWDPIECWEYIYAMMIKSQLSSKVIAVIEDRYVCSILEKNNLFEKDSFNYLPDIQTVISVVTLCARIINIALGALTNGN